MRPRGTVRYALRVRADGFTGYLISLHLPRGGGGEFWIHRPLFLVSVDRVSLL